ncbi:MAG: hypothetical protein RBR09_13055 [Desulfobulbaceae bacterium]|jgi:hypothetical protein|nr:hypothetical protein [Desulfobulbaceae bacterium]MDY0352178.1 hypothetical protein [Desulfobulbaceae bacterium]
MGDVQAVPGMSANLKKAVCWLSETVQDHPERNRDDIISEAELRFDLTPRECEFLDKNFRKLIAKKC